MTHKKLLGENEEIDYDQIGLDFTLYKCEILFNRAMCYAGMEKDQQCTLDIFLAKKCAVTPIHQRTIVKTGREGMEAVNLFTLALGTIFQIPESKSRNMDKRLHLKESQILKVDGMELKRESSRLASALAKSATLIRPRASSILSRANSSASLPRSAHYPKRKTSLTYNRSRSRSNPESFSGLDQRASQRQISGIASPASSESRSPLSFSTITPDTPPSESIFLNPVQEYIKIKVKSPEHVIALKAYSNTSFQEIRQKIKSKLHLATLPNLCHDSTMIAGNEEFLQLLKTPGIRVLTITIDDDIFDFY